MSLSEWLSISGFTGSEAPEWWLPKSGPVAQRGPEYSCFLRQQVPCVWNSGIGKGFFPEKPAEAGTPQDFLTLDLWSNLLI